MEETFDLVVVGATMYGLPMAKTFQQVHPTKSLLILDYAQTVGGTWAEERLYKDLYTNNLAGMFEYSDLSMDYETFGVAEGQCIPGEVVHAYFEAYVRKFELLEKIRFRSIVTSVTLQGDGTWLVRVMRDGESSTLRARKLVLATGTTSEPRMQCFEGQETFDGQILHSKELSFKPDGLDSMKRVAVLGGSKSAVDAVYTFASKGKHVEWIIRASGKGPAWVTEAHVSPFKLHFEKLGTTRFVTFFSACFDNDGYAGIRRFLHGTRVGRSIVRGLFRIIDSDLIKRGAFRKHLETEKLIPPNSIYWSGTSVGVFAHPSDFFGLVRKGLVNIHIADIISLGHHAVHLSDLKARQSSIAADTLICATGWKQQPTMDFEGSSSTEDIGWLSLSCADPRVQAADAEILARFPELRDRPTASTENSVGVEQQECWSLYHGVVPPAFIKRRNFAWAGMSLSLRGCLCAEIQALWTMAFFDDKLSTGLPSHEEAAWEALLQSRFYWQKAPMGLGGSRTDMVFETIPYIDTLMRELGLDPARKGSWWKEMFGWYGVKDYEGVVEEWLTKMKRSE